MIHKVVIIVTTRDIQLLNDNEITFIILRVAAPPEFDAPTFYRVVSDTKLVVVLYPASPENGDITHYYVVLVPDELTHGRRTEDFKLDEV